MTWPLDARDTSIWLEKYDRAKRSFVGGFISRIEALDALRNLRYRDDALRIEILEWEREREQTRAARRASALRKEFDAARQRQLDHDMKETIEHARTPTSPSSV